jgi:hypothetical protein
MQRLAVVVEVEAVLPVKAFGLNLLTAKLLEAFQ